MKLPELLSPAGNADCALAAFDAGADAVYAGLSKFNARERGDNFTEERLCAVVDHAHKNGKKVYFAIVTLLLIFFAGFRDLSVGTDTKSYVNGFLKCEPFSEVSWGEFIKEESEFLYFMYRSIIRQITEHYVWFLLPISVFYIIVVSRFIYKYSDYPSISFLVFQFS